jgi:hypothetical protein
MKHIKILTKLDEYLSNDIYPHELADLLQDHLISLLLEISKNSNDRYENLFLNSNLYDTVFNIRKIEQILRIE